MNNLSEWTQRGAGAVVVIDDDGARRAQLEAILRHAGETVVSAVDEGVDVILATADARDEVDRLRLAPRPKAVVWIGKTDADPTAIAFDPSSEGVASTLQFALRAARAERDLALIRDHAAQMEAVSAAVVANAPSEAGIRRIAEAAIELTRSTTAAVILTRDESGAALDLFGVVGEPAELGGQMADHVRATSLGLLRPPAIRQATGAEWDRVVERMHLPLAWRVFRAGISLPLVAGNERLGSLAVWRREERPFDGLDVTVLQHLATLASLAFANRELASRSTRLGREGRTIREQMSDAVLILDAERRVVEVNSAYERLYGVRFADIVGRSVDELPVRYFVEGGAPTAEPVTSSRPVRFESGAHTGWVSISSAPLRDADGTLVGTVSVQRDVTAQQDSVEQQQRIETLRALGQMAAGVAHDFNNALALILGRSEIAQEELLAGEPRLVDLEESLLAIRQAALDAASTIRRLQEFARERPTSAFGSVDVAELLREAASLTRPRWYNDAQRRGIRIALEVRTESLPPVAGDESELRDALTNLIFNAVDALPNGGRIVLSATRQQEHVVIQVRDDGVGMSEEVRRRVFEPYFTTKGERGSGLGMAMVYAVVNRHRGEIEIDSAVGRGTTITIRLPFGSPRSVEPSSVPTADRVGRVLVLDDEPGIATMMARMLTRDGHTVVSYTRPHDAIAALERERFDIVVTDLGMPEMSGWEVAAAAKQRDSTTRVVVATGWGGEFDRDAPAAAHVDAILPKPFQFQRLREVVRSLLDHALPE